MLRPRARRLGGGAGGDETTVPVEVFRIKRGDGPNAVPPKIAASRGRGEAGGQRGGGEEGGCFPALIAFSVSTHALVICSSGDSVVLFFFDIQHHVLGRLLLFSGIA